jgi:predicted AAA+ superfamily ATPase
MVTREAVQKIIQLSKSFKAIAITGARQTGKTTLVKAIFKEKIYVSLENPDTRNFAITDPRGFLANYPNGAILDEVQRVPNLFSYLQEILDESKTKGLFILTGSNNFLLQQSISQSLAGRVGYLNLLPFSAKELNDAGLLPTSDDELMIKGFYPPVYDQEIDPKDWCPNYIHTYIEKDVRQIKNITDLIVFERFVRLLAGRTGQELNSSSLAVETGVDVKTIQSWIGILESSFIIYLLKPHHINFNKTIVKRPKIYFYDTALVCYLLGIQTAVQLSLHHSRGAIFETMVITELIKKRTNKGESINLFYWREKTGREIDIIVDTAGKLLPVEIKAGKTISNEFFRNIEYWCKLSQQNQSILLYGGEQEQKRSDGKWVMNWRLIIDKDI